MLHELLFTEQTSSLFVFKDILKNSIPVADFSIEFSVGSVYITCVCAGWLKTLRFQYQAALTDFGIRWSTFHSSSKNINL